MDGGDDQRDGQGDVWVISELGRGGCFNLISWGVIRTLLVGALIVFWVVNKDLISCLFVCFFCFFLSTLP